MDVEVVYYIQIEKFEDQFRFVVEVKVCKLFIGFYVFMVLFCQWKKDSNFVIFFLEGKMYFINLCKYW